MPYLGEGFVFRYSIVLAAGTVTSLRCMYRLSYEGPVDISFISM